MNMQVKLIAHTPDPERLCAAAAKLCHEPDENSFEDMYNQLDDNTIGNILAFVLKMGHESVIEHASFTFSIEGVSRTLTHQLVRHRIASYSQQSQRYVTLRNFDYVVPDGIKESDFEDRYRESMESIRSFYQDMLKDNKVRPEDARFILPNATHTKIVTTMNARALRNFFNLRMEVHAQWEIRELAREMLVQVMDVAPRLFKDIKERFDKEGDEPEGEMFE